MSDLIRIIIITYVVIVVFLFVDVSEGSRDVVSAHHRGRRFLSFLNISHFFMRLNFKANMVPWNQFFAQALGYRMNWDEPPDSFHPYRHVLHRRSLYTNMQEALEKNDIQGYHCIRRAVCEVNSIESHTGIYEKILKIIFKNSDTTSKWHNMNTEDCLESIPKCPISVLEVSQFTDI